MTLLNHALKEWNMVINALTEGQTIMLLRKGGIHEVGGKFQVAHQQVLLYPTFEHQKIDLLKPDELHQLNPLSIDRESDSILLKSWAEITHIFSVREARLINQLEPYHIGNKKFVTERLKWKPNEPIYVLLLRTYHLNPPVTIPHHSSYGGCRSWINLKQEIPLSKSQPVLSEKDYQKICREICEIVQPSQE